MRWALTSSERCFRRVLLSATLALETRDGSRQSAVAYCSYPVAAEVERVVEQALSSAGLERLSVARRILESIEREAGEEVERG